MFDLQAMGLAFVAGGVGTLIGGTQTFIITGFIGIIVFVLQICGIPTQFLNDVVLNTFFLPCIIFNGAGFATAYAAKHYSIRGVDTGRSLAFTHDPFVILSGSLAGVLGYFIYAFANAMKFPMDTGALSVGIVGLLGRLLFNQEQNYNQAGIDFLKKHDKKVIIYELLFAGLISFSMSYFALETGFYTIGFSISALSLIFGLSDMAFPATHHITLVAGYAVMYTQNIFMGVLFGILAEIIFFVFGIIFNTDCGTHIDPPAIAIGICSLLIFTIF